MHCWTVENIMDLQGVKRWLNENRHENTEDQLRPGWQLLLLHCLCFLLVMGYVNMFQFWAWLSSAMGHGLLTKLLPILVTLVVLLFIAVRFIQRVNRGYRIEFVFLGLGIVAAFLALAIPDPDVPIKRIHVAEYIVLAFVVRYVLSHRLQGVQLLMFTALVTALYGVHDEMLQGLHPLRYYGWRDMTVNAMAGLSGAMLAHGLLCFARPEVNSTGEISRITPGRIVLFGCLLAAVVWQVAYLFLYRDDIRVLLAIMPVAVCAGLVGGMDRETVLSSLAHHGLQAVYWLSLGLLAYPLAARLSGMEFL